MVTAVSLKVTISKPKIPINESLLEFSTDFHEKY